jgi:ribonuclease D
MTPALHVTTSAELETALERLTAGDFIALDTEFMRESTYFAKLCLIQAANSGFTVTIDPLARLDLTPLWRVLADRTRLKVLHAARQDLEVLLLAVGGELVPGPVFDTQIAAALLGLPAQIGYGNLVAQRLNHALDKGHARTDWERRPLTDEQLDYAADDARYLAPLYLDLRAALEAAGRLSWLEEETRELEDPSLYRTDPALAWRRLKGLDRLQRPQRAAARLLAQWREELAVSHDKPRGWILADEALREIADALPATPEALQTLRIVPAAVLRKRGNDILELIRRAHDQAANEPELTPPARPDPRELALVTKLMAHVRAEGERQKISPEILATRRDVEQLVFSGRTEHLLRGWRRAVIGEELIAKARRA